MADIRPFKMVHYNGKCATQLNSLITPPYDVISEEEQEAFYQSDPLNIIRLVLGKQFPDDNDGNNRYTRAGSTLNQWMEDGTLVRKDRPGLTLYRMEFDELENGRLTIDGLVALVKVDDYGKGRVLPHEKTYKGPKEDQLRIMRACKANITPIHALFDDENDEVVEEYSRFFQGKPEQETTDANGTTHQTWTIDDEETIARIVGLLRDKSIFIADGHHRYETARAYKEELNASGQGRPGGEHEYVMMYLTSMTHPGLTILPAHRMVKGLKEIDVAKILERLEPYFHAEALCFSEHDRYEVSQKLIQRIRSYAQVGGKFGMVVRGENCFQLLRLRDFRSITPLMDPSIPRALRNLDVTILREVIMGYGLGLDRDSSEGHIEYSPLVSDALNKVMKGAVQMSFILNPTRVDQMRVAAELGHKLPQKSTYFYPKLSSGLVLNVYENR